MIENMAENLRKTEEELKVEDEELMRLIFDPTPRETIIATARPSPANLAIYYADIEAMRLNSLQAEAESHNLWIG